MGFDDGAVVVSMGREEPAVSMDPSGKLIWARQNEVLSAVIKGTEPSIKDGSVLSLSSKVHSNFTAVRMNRIDKNRNWEIVTYIRRL